MQTAAGKNFMRMADNAPALIWIADTQNQGTWFNKRWLEYTGRSLKQELGTGWSEGVHPDDLAQSLALCTDAFSSRRPFEMEFRLRRADGSYGWIADTGIPSFTPEGEFEGYIGYCWDISSRKQAEQSLRESVQHTQAILDNAVDGIITINGSGTVESFNRSASKIFGYSAEEVIGHNVNMLMPEPYASQHDGYLNNYHTSGIPRIIGIGREVEGRRRDGSVFPMELAVSHISRKGQPMYVGLVRDISERKQVEKLKSEFLSTVSHELRTPLTSITGALGLAVSGVLGELPGKVRHMVEIAHKNSQRLVHLINDLLDLEKMAAGKMPFDLQVQPLMPLVTQAMEGMHGYADQHQVRLEQTEAHEADVRVDAGRLLQILNNLLSNAIKFSPEKGRVEIAVRRNNDKVRVEIIDQGPGIPAEFRTRIFQKFSQADSSDTRKAGGTGLGLAISRELAERMNSSVGFDAKEGQGSSFYVELPVQKTLTDTQTAETEAEPRQDAPHLLVVEDDPDVARLLEIMLQRAGYRVDMAPDGKTALARLEQQRYDAMTLDLVLPDLNGTELIRRIRDKAEISAIPIIVVSAHANEGRLAINGDFAAIDWLGKPVDEKQLVSLLRRNLNNHPGQKPKVLYVEDDGDLFETISTLCRDEADFEAARTIAQAKEKLALNRYALVVLDIILPDGSGWELLPLIKDIKPEPPVIVLSASELSAEQKAKVQAALVKTRSSGEEFLSKLKRQINPTKSTREE